ncbi:MAG TPA: ferredoxin--NADP reductase [Steroidobacteraceae bacterium]|jgi:ferredoxin--NADP+ reductase|nr:ferredoxin--NADP reductase [Steroidobacteraceae bacterium]
MIGTERVLAVRHWTDAQFTFTTTRDSALRFENGQFVMLGLPGDGRPVLRAYSIASANHDEHLEFLSIKVAGGPLTSRLRHVQPGDEVLVSRKPTGTLLLADLNPGERLYLMSTGTGAAPFLSLIRDPELYERFATVILAHGVRYARESAVVAERIRELTGHELLGAPARRVLRYYPAATREAHRHAGRLTQRLASGRLAADLGLPPPDPARDRFMICGNPAMLADACALLDARGFRASPGIGERGDYLIERAFVAR